MRDQRVFALYNTRFRFGSAIVTLPGGRVFTILDLNTTDNTCAYK
jgi:hypothetical protein